MNTKAPKTRQKLHTDTMAIRLAPEIKAKFETLCRAEYQTPSYVIRDFILEYVRNRTASLTTLATQQPKQSRPAYEYDLSKPTMARPPSAQDWNDWGDEV